jgi:hypothetical protein
MGAAEMAALWSANSVAVLEADPHRIRTGRPRHERSAGMSDWQLAFENDANGNALQGSLGALTKHVENGSDIKIGYALHSDYVIVWRRLCTSATVTTDFGSNALDEVQVVSGIVTDIPDTNVAIQPLPGASNESKSGGLGGRTFVVPPAFEWQIFSTSGQRQILKFNPKTMEVLSNSTSNISIS